MTALIVLLLLWSGAARAVTVVDTFDQWNPEVWTDTSTCGTAQVVGGELVLTKQSGCVGTTTADWVSTLRIVGDLDITVDFGLPSFGDPPSGFQYRYHSIKLVGVGGGLLGGIERWRIHTAGSCEITNGYKTYTSSTEPCASTFAAATDASGRFRLERTGTAFRTSWWDGGAWQVLLQDTVPTDDVRISLVGGSGNGLTEAHVGTFDNLSVTADSIVPVAAPETDDLRPWSMVKASYR
jgi:hypothetical protein